MTTETPITKEVYLADMKAHYEEAIKEYESHLSIACLTSTPFVIRCGGIYINPNIQGNQVMPGPAAGWECNPLRATRFNKQDASTIAATTTNGNDDKGEAVGINQAVRDELEKAKSQIEWITEMQEAKA